MNKPTRFKFSKDTVEYYFSGGIGKLKKLSHPDRTVLVTDEHVFEAHPARFKGWNTIVLKPGEAYKVQATVDSIIAQLIEFQADRSWTLVGIGGGVVTDMTGYAASVYMRGIRFGFVPSTLLAMVDASIGGKNGIDIGPYKNLVGTIRQPAFLLYDVELLKSLPQPEWTNGFAEIIKHAAILDKAMFRDLQATTPAKLQKNRKALATLIERNAKLKSRLVQKDEFEKGDRKLLNFGHTLGHAFETTYALSHGQAISIGMTCASMLSEDLIGFRDHEALRNLLQAYGLPTFLKFDAERVLEVLKMDKKRAGQQMNFILLEKIGKARVHPISMDLLAERVTQLSSR